MKIIVRVKPNAKQAKILPDGPGRFSIAVTAPPAEGRANEAVRRALAKHLGVAQSRLTLISGATAREKVFEVD